MYKELHLVKTNQSIIFKESLDSNYGCYMWPSSVLLCMFIATHPDILAEKRVLEVGSGIGLVGLIASRFSKSVVMTDMDNKDILDNLNNVIKLNKFDNCAVQPLNWGWPIVELNGKFDCIIGSDVFYNPCDFESLLFTIHYIFRYNSTPGAVFITSYQERSSKRRIKPLLDKFGLECNVISFEAAIDLIPDYLRFSSGKLVNEMKQFEFNDISMSSIFLLKIFPKQTFV
ncbi:putative methyltransferase-domain-containing protein [Globomyces pollinis-pini]|nr:putative methyltransferase-domain-containing protein [Globomyces pollinis-pini]